MSQSGDVCYEKGIICLSEQLSGTLIICCCHSELWDRFISFPFVKCCQLIPVLRGMRKEAMKHSFSEFREFKQLLSWVQLNFHSVRNLFQKKGLFEQSPTFPTWPETWLLKVNATIAYVWIGNCFHPWPFVGWLVCQHDYTKTTEQVNRSLPSVEIPKRRMRRGDLVNVNYG